MKTTWIAWSIFLLTAAQPGLAQPPQVLEGDLQELTEALASAEVASVGEVHPREGIRVRAIDFFREALVPMVLQQGYSTFLIEHFPAVVSPITDERFYRIAGTVLDLHLAGDAHLRSFSDRMKGGDGVYKAYQALRARGKFVGGSGLPHEVIVAELSTDGEADIGRDAEYIRHFAEASFAYARSYLPPKLLMYGGAAHNDRRERPDMARHGLHIAAGPAILRAVRDPAKYLSIDIVPLETLETGTIRGDRTDGVHENLGSAQDTDDVDLDGFSATTYRLIQIAGAKRGYSFDRPTVVKNTAEKTDVRAFADYVIFLPPSAETKQP